MKTEKNFTPQSLLDVKFVPNQKGYNPDDVDLTLDKIIADYKEYEKQIESLQQINANQLSEIEKLQKTIRENGIELAKLKDTLSKQPTNSGVTVDNRRLLEKIVAYENFLISKGYDKHKIFSDPDNC